MELVGYQNGSGFLKNLNIMIFGGSALTFIVIFIIVGRLIMNKLET